MIETGILLQVDAAVIAGVLILLTVGQLKTESIQNVDRFHMPITYKATFLILPAFTASAISLLVTDIMPFLVKDFPSGLIKAWVATSEVMTMLGFFYLMILAFWIIKKTPKGLRNN